MSLPEGTYRIMNANDNTFLLVDPENGAVSSVDANNLSPVQKVSLIWSVRKITVNGRTAFGLENVATQMWLHVERGVSWAWAYKSSSPAPADDAQFNLDPSKTFPGALQIHPAVVSTGWQLAADRPQDPPTTSAWWEANDPGSKRGTWYFLAISDLSSEAEVEGDAEVGVSSERAQA